MNDHPYIDDTTPLQPPGGNSTIKGTISGSGLFGFDSIQGGPIRPRGTSPPYGETATERLKRLDGEERAAMLMAINDHPDLGPKQRDAMMDLALATGARTYADAADACRHSTRCQLAGASDKWDDLLMAIGEALHLDDLVRAIATQMGRIWRRSPE